MLACYFLVWPVWRAQFPIEIWFTELWNAFHQDIAAAGLRYSPAAALVAGRGPAHHAAGEFSWPFSGLKEFPVRGRI